MPVRNVVKYNSAYTYYHVYNRGHNKMSIYLDDEDYQFYQFLLMRSFGNGPVKRAGRGSYPWFGDLVSLSAYCLMPNHFHLLLHQKENTNGVAKAMHSIGTTYAMYFNRKYNKRGSLFESIYKSAPIMHDPYLQHITRYIHLNHSDYKTWPYSSYRDYLTELHRSWVDVAPILGLFSSRLEYAQFVNDYVSLKKVIDELKDILADNGETY